MTLVPQRTATLRHSIGMWCGLLSWAPWALCSDVALAQHASAAEAEAEVKAEAEAGGAEAEGGDTEAEVAPSAVQAEEESQSAVQWNERWQRFRVWQYPVTAAMLGGSLAVRFGVARPGSRWEEGILFDDAVRDAFAVRSNPGRQLIVAYTDWHLGLALLYMVLDPVLAAGVGHDGWDAVLQMEMISVQSTAFVFLAVWSLQHVADRERPFQPLCADPAFSEIEPNCKDDSPEWNRSFISGHAAFAVAGAGLTCMHHGHMPVYGGGFWDHFACGASIVLAGLNGLGRVATENHWPTDVVLGFGLGAFAGWGIPALLHYGFADGGDGGRNPQGEPGPVVAAAPALFAMPFATEDSGGIELLGAF